MLDNLSEQTTAEKSAQKTAQETQQLRKQGQPGVKSLLAAPSKGTGRFHAGLHDCCSDMACMKAVRIRAPSCPDRQERICCRALTFQTRLAAGACSSSASPQQQVG